MKFQWVKYDEWYVARHTNEGLLIHGNLEDPATLYDRVKEWGPILLPPVPYEPRPQRVATEVAEVQVATDAIERPKSNKPVYIIGFFSEVHSQKPNDCGVVALANVLQITYKEARVLCLHGGWSSTKGMGNGFVEHICTEHGLELTHHDIGGTVRDFNTHGVWLLIVRKHIMAAINGKVLNVIDRQILEAYELHK